MSRGGEAMTRINSIPHNIPGSVVEGPGEVHDPHVVGARTSVEGHRPPLIHCLIRPRTCHGRRDVQNGDVHGIRVPIPCGILHREGYHIRPGDREDMARIHAVQGGISRAVIEGP